MTNNISSTFELVSNGMQLYMCSIAKCLLFEADKFIHILILQKMFQKWGYMPKKVNGCWLFPNRRGEWKDVTCTMIPEATSSSTTTPPSQPITYESISELVASEISPNNEPQSTDEEDNMSPLTPEEREKFLKSIWIFQETFHLTVTGRLDVETIRTINSRVCGVPDRLGTNFESETDEGDDESDANSEEIEAVDGENRTSNEVTEYHGEHDHTTPSSKQTPLTMLTTVSHADDSTIVTSELVTATTNSATSEDFDYSLTEIVTETSSEIYTDSTVALVTPSVTTESTRTLPTTGDSPSSDSWRRKRNIPSKLENVLHRRSKRTMSNSDTSCLRFTTNNPIKWRIVKKYPSDSNTARLSDSTSFTRDTLREKLAKAFSLWARVSRLSFVEQTWGSISDIDIQIRFITTDVSGTMGKFHMF